VRVADNFVFGDQAGDADAFIRDRCGVQPVAHTMVNGIVFDQQDIRYPLGW
jgi:hypothetical protein